MDRNATPESYQAQALALCGGRARCRVLGWTDAARTPGGFPIYPGLLDGMAYSYMRDSSTKIERSLWNCEQFPRSNASQCMLERDPTKIRSEEHTSELQSLMRISYAVFCLKKKNTNKQTLVHTT